MAQPPLPPVPPLSKDSFNDPTWQRWLSLLRANLTSAITSLQIATANGFSGTVTPGTPATITLGVTVTGLLKGSGGAIVAATAGTDYVHTVSVTAPITNTGTAADPNIGHATSGVVAGTYTKVTVDVRGHVTTGANIASGDVTGALGYTPLNPANNLSDVSNIGTSRTNLGLGTMATQNANAVAITGGSINTTPIGAGGTANGNFSVLLSNANSTVRAATTNALVVATGAFLTITTWTTTKNLGANFVAATGVYTVPLAGEYDVRCAVRFAASAGALNAQCLVAVFVNGVERYGSGVTYNTASATVAQASGSWMLTCATSDLITVRVFQNSGGNLTLDATAVANWLNIQQMTEI